MCDRRTRSEKANDISLSEGKKTPIQLGLSQSDKSQYTAVAEDYTKIDSTQLQQELSGVQHILSTKTNI